MYPLPESIFIGYRLFKLMIDQSELTFHIAILDLKNRKPLFFLISLFCEISNLKNSESKNILFERVEFFCK
jgi:hypothetical protein